MNNMMRWAAASIVMAMAAVACSSSDSGSGAGGAGGSAGSAGSGGSAGAAGDDSGAAGAAGDDGGACTAPTATDSCTTCAWTNCQTEYCGCTAALTDCGSSFGDFVTCLQSGSDPAADCEPSFSVNSGEGALDGGTPASDLATCVETNCATECAPSGDAGTE